MSTFDLKLIHEFRLSPALYDRNSAHFKDKLFVGRTWNNIARKLRHDANILKDRMYQLRNRYNLEKRKMQSLRDEGVPNPTPMWPLYHNLNFLSTHIRQRKSYKTMRTIRDETGFRGFTKHEGKYRPHSINPIVKIKKELDDPLLGNGNERVNGDASTHMEDAMNVSDSNYQDNGNKTSETLRNITRLKQSLLADDNDDNKDCSDISSPEEIGKNHHPSQKFEAFGSFVSNSLQDLPVHKALAMIDRFTSEIVRSLNENQPEFSE